ncbi:hypothetical protein GCM10010182_71200 [Actinomadura cremea]|nr:hypothetical protein GCM10010182_71200 [Actinomadura cremea]
MESGYVLAGSTDVEGTFERRRIGRGADIGGEGQIVGQLGDLAGADAPRSTAA